MSFFRFTASLPMTRMMTFLKRFGPPAAIIPHAHFRPWLLSKTLCIISTCFMRKVHTIVCVQNLTRGRACKAPGGMFGVCTHHGRVSNAALPEHCCTFSRFSLKQKTLSSHFVLTCSTQYSKKTQTMNSCLCRAMKMVRANAFVTVHTVV